MVSEVLRWEAECCGGYGDRGVSRDLNHDLLGTGRNRLATRSQALQVARDRKPDVRERIRARAPLTDTAGKRRDLGDERSVLILLDNYTIPGQCGLLWHAATIQPTPTTYSTVSTRCVPQVPGTPTELSRRGRRPPKDTATNRRKIR